jgi:hypothetical protein
MFFLGGGVNYGYKNWCVRLESCALENRCVVVVDQRNWVLRERRVLGKKTQLSE